MSKDSTTARVDTHARGADLVLEQTEKELPQERDIMSELHREAEEFKADLEERFPKPYVKQMFREFPEVIDA